MKFISILALCAVITLSSCVSKKIVEQAEGQRDSLAMVVSTKDSLINTVFEDINIIAENIELIKSRENLITVMEGSEGGRRPVEEINNNIAAIDRLLQENKAKIASLQYAAGQLRKANLRIKGLEKMISDLNTQLADKKTEIAQLRERLSKIGIEVQNLSEQVAERTSQIQNLSGEKVELENQLNTVYYIVGAEKELRETQIVEKQGLVGRTLTVNTKGNLASFTKADSRLLTEIPIGKKKVTIVSTHPDGSYELIADANKMVTKLVIKDPARFWESSKMLVVSYK